MERVISPEERMRRAEEIYYRRRAQGVRLSTSSVNLGKQNRVSLGKKMCIQILVCVIIYSGFWVVKGNNNIFSENVIDKTKMVLSYDINFQNVYNRVVEYFNKNFNSIIKTDNNSQSSQGDNETQNSLPKENGVDQSNQEQNEEQNQEQNEEQNQEQNQENTLKNEEQSVQSPNEEGNDLQNLGVGGGSEVCENAVQNKTQMELDAEYIKQNCNLIIPVQGIITSGFGEREPTEIISAFHQGVDIGAVTGTSIKASMDGTVVAASYAGDYGNHIKIQNGNVLMVYAHCSELNVSVGNIVKQGQEIGKVGATGKVTGPHLHFEIRKDNRYVNPALVLNF